MKIVANKKETVLVEVTHEEFAHLIGEYSKYDVNFKELEDVEIPINEIYTQHYQLTELLNSPDYTTARYALNNMLKALEPIEDLITKAKEKYEIK